MTELAEDQWRFHAARSDVHRHANCQLPWYLESRYAKPRRRWMSEPALLVDRPADLKKMPGLHTRRRIVSQPKQAPARAQPPPLDGLLQAFPARSLRWAVRLVHALMSQSESELDGKTLTEIAGQRVPKRISRDVVAMVLDTTAARKPGKTGKRSIVTMAGILLVADKTADALAEWRARAPQPETISDPTVERYVIRTRIETQTVVEFFRNPDAETAPYQIPDPYRIAQELDRQHLAVA